MKLQRLLEQLNQMLFTMCDTTIENIKAAIDFYFGKIEAEEVNINDDLVDQYERAIESLCLHILLKERPYARDLKEVTGVLKLIADIERIADHAEDIHSLALKAKNTDKPIHSLDQLSVYVLKMFEDVVRAYINKDLVLAQEVINRDDYVDSEYDKIINEYINLEEKDISFAIYNTLVVKYLERIADHSVNIAEWVIYIVKGYHKDKKIF
ncbi:phosphate signaling complex protein PhoU [bacterium]|jgi:phosphate transport system protein|nr:phosphate signaling complex protein PhoU [bacterium]